MKKCVKLCVKMCMCIRIVNTGLFNIEQIYTTGEIYNKLDMPSFTPIK